jgi:hypothetical protein
MQKKQTKVFNNVLMGKYLVWEYEFLNSVKQTQEDC